MQYYKKCDCGGLEEGGRRKGEGGRRKKEGGRRKEEGGRGRRKEDGGRRKEEGERRKEEAGREKGKRGRRKDIRACFSKGVYGLIFSGCLKFSIIELKGMNIRYNLDKK